MKPVLVTMGVIAALSYSAACLYGAYVGISHHLGVGWAIAAFVIAMPPLKITPHIAVGAFFGAWSVWGWHWAAALFFAAPWLVVIIAMLPGMAADLWNGMRSR